MGTSKNYQIHQADKKEAASYRAKCRQSIDFSRYPYETINILSCKIALCC